VNHLLDRTRHRRCPRSFQATALAVVLLASIPRGAAEPASEVPWTDTRDWSSKIKPPIHPVPLVLLLKKPGIWTYEKTIEEFRGGVRGEVQTISVDPRRGADLRTWIRKRRPALIFAVGQAAYDLISPIRDIPVVHAFVFERRVPAHYAVSVAIPAADTLRAFTAARPGIRAIGVVHGPATDPLVLTAHAVASSLGLKLVDLRADSPMGAISTMRRAVPRINGIWLLPDLELLRPQVFQYALVLQSRLHLPLMGVTRRHAERGALLALDYDPHDVGRQAAVLASQIMAGEAPQAPPLKPRLTVNQGAARGLGADLEALRDRAVKVYR